jgi:hypothetical protein
MTADDTKTLSGNKWPRRHAVIVDAKIETGSPGDVFGMPT